jgi:hypothetical protein
MMVVADPAAFAQNGVAATPLLGELIYELFT